MKTAYPFIRTVTLILGILSLFWLVFDIVQINTRLEEILDFHGSGYLAEIGYFFILLFHFSAFLFLLMHIWRSGEVKSWITFTFIMIILSLFMVGVEKVMFDEIGRELRSGLEIRGEVLGLCFAFFINVLCTLLVLGVTFRSFAANETERKESVLRDEIIFILAQYMGIVSGLGGLYLTFSLLARGIPASRLWIYIPFYFLFLLPYGLSVLYWLTLKRKEKITGWYDEKQFQDILKSSLFTLILSLPAMAVLFFLPLPAPFYGFLYYFFFILLSFSSGTLYFFRIKDSD